MPSKKKNDELESSKGLMLNISTTSRDYASQAEYAKLCLAASSKVMHRAAEVMSEVNNKSSQRGKGS